MGKKETLQARSRARSCPAPYGSVRGRSQAGGEREPGVGGRGPPLGHEQRHRLEGKW